MKRRAMAGLLVTAGLIGWIGPVAPVSASPVGESTTFEEIQGSSAPVGIAKGPDGSMWLTERIASRIASVGTRRGTLFTASIAGRAAVARH